MGQTHSSGPPPSIDALHHRLTARFAKACYTPLELYIFNRVFTSLAESSSGVKYWSEPTLCRFLELPDALAGVGQVLFQMCGYIGAFPFPSRAPAILEREALLRVVTVMTERDGRVLKRGKRSWWAEIYRSLAVYEKVLEKGGGGGGGGEHGDDGKVAEGEYTGFAVDEPGDEEEEQDDDLVLAALDSMDAADAFKQGEKSSARHSMIPSDNLLKLIQLLLLVAPMDAQESLSTFAVDLSEHRIARLRRTAKAVLSSFGVDHSPGVNFKTFLAVVSTSTPYLFNGFTPLFEHFLFAKDFDLSKRKASTASVASEQPSTPPSLHPSASSSQPPPPPREPLLPPSTAEILTLPLLSQISFFIPGATLFRRLQPLYSGGTDGFSLGSFEKKVLNWPGPSILLVSGSLLSPHGDSTSERNFLDTLPPKRLPNSTASANATVIYGAYIPVPWKPTHRTCFSDSSTLLFQLAPTHDVFHASPTSTDYAYFNKPPTLPAGLGFGSPIPHQTPSSSSHAAASDKPLNLGPVSLHINAALEFAVFTHLASPSDASFAPSRLPGRRDRDFQDRFAVESLEVWGCGGDAEAEEQRKRWAWEEREAEARRRINLGTGDVEADRELLRLAGLIGGQGRDSGGSMG